MNDKVNVIIMAGGLGKRMESDIPKVLHKINNVPLIVSIIQTINKINFNKIFIIVGKYKNIIKSTIEKYIITDQIEYIIQEEPLGTGNAIQCCYNKLLMYHNYKTIILSGDVPLIKAETLEKIINLKKNCVILTAELEEPFGYGRIIKNKDKFIKIQEEKDCTEEEKKICEINSGIYLIQSSYLISNIINITNNNQQKEYYLTDIFKLLTDKGIDVHTLKLDICNNYQIFGINTKKQLEELNNFIQNY